MATKAGQKMRPFAFCFGHRLDAMKTSLIVPGRDFAEVHPRLSRSRLAIVRLVGAAIFCAGSTAVAQQPSAPPPAVVVEKVEMQQATNPARFTGRVEAIESVDVRARVTGYLRAVTFRDGQEVKAGDTLFEIEPDQLEAQVASAQAQVARAEATRTSAERTLGRNKTLLERNSVSQAAVDDAQAAFDIAVADVQVAQAALTTAKLNLSYTRVNAPISGSVGRATFTAGNLVGSDSGSLVRIVSLDPIRVAFAMAEGLLVTVRQHEAGGNSVDPKAFKLSLHLANGTEYDQPGKIDFVENEVDAQTGTVTARAAFPNPHHILLPGQFITLSIQEKEAAQLPVVPQTAVLQDRKGRFVYLLDKNNAVSQRRIETGARIGNGWAVTTGLNGGEQVVVQGIQRLADGMIVQPSEGQPIGGGL
jgi:membrane fusion protein (multidrug efflux system)